ncbi:MAG: hypothetical protein ABIK65_12550 [Candidatus Eisenbacteria bacterium]
MNRPTLPLRKRTAFTLVLLLLALLLVEGFVFLAYWAIEKRPFPRSEFRTAMALAGRGGDPAADRETEGGEITVGDRWVEVIHPYQGFVQHPEKNPDRSVYGFPGGEADLFVGRGAGRLVIGVFGGSFAAETHRYGMETIARELEPLGKEVVLLNLAMGGYKQPQQLLTLSYFLSLGAEFDGVVNIDGFNEVALPLAENVPGGVNPFFPRKWSWRVMGTLPPESITDLAEMGAIDRRRRSFARTFSESPLRRSVTASLIWRFGDGRIERRRAEIERSLATRGRSSTDYSLTGPPAEFKSDWELCAALAANWERSSRLMNDLCLANGAVYLHFLQPNQYVEGSKPMGEEERRVAIYLGHPYRPGVLLGYPLLCERGRALASEGIPFHDLTMIYSGIPDAIYRDSCCHPNERGYRLVARAVGEALFAALSGGRELPPRSE